MATSTILLPADVTRDQRHAKWDTFTARWTPVMEDYLATRFPAVDKAAIVRETLTSLNKALFGTGLMPEEDKTLGRYLAGTLKHKAARATLRDAARMGREPAPLPHMDDAKWRNSLFEIALRMTLADEAIHFKSREIFRRVAVCHESPDSVGAAFGITVAEARQVKGRLMVRFKKLISLLEKVDGGRNSVQGVEPFLEAHEPIPTTATFKCGTLFGTWRLEAFLGRSSSIEVYRAVHVSLSMQSAVKILMLGDAAAKEKFQRETSFLYKHKSPALPQLYGSGEKEGRPFMVLELLEPTELPMGDGDTAKYISAIAEGVDFMHRNGIAHNDLKRKNIMHRSDNSIVLCDLGKADVIAGANAGLKSSKSSNRQAAIIEDILQIGALSEECFLGFPPRAWSLIIRRSTGKDPIGFNSAGEIAKAIKRRHLARNILVTVATIIAATFAALFAMKYFGFSPMA